MSRKPKSDWVSELIEEGNNVGTKTTAEAEEVNDLMEKLRKRSAESTEAKRKARLNDFIRKAKSALEDVE